MAALMASLATTCQVRGNQRPAPHLRLRGACHCCHHFSKSSRKIKIQKSFANYVATLATTPPHTHQGVMRIILICMFEGRHEAR
jgi:Fe-S cluster biogenesis protein NfuA